MEEKKQEQNRIWDARIALKYNNHELKLNILVLAGSNASAKEKAVEWGKKYAEENCKSISKRIVYNARLKGSPDVRILGTSFCAFI